MPPRQAPDPTPRRPSAPTPRSLALPQDGTLRAALAAATDDRIVYDLDGIEAQYAALLRELPGVGVRFALKACPVDEVLACLAQLGAGCDAASPHEIEQALRAGVPVGLIHYGNTVKSDRNIAEAYRLGVRDFATDSLADVTAIAVHAPGSRCSAGSPPAARARSGAQPEVRLLARGRRPGPGSRAGGRADPAGLSVHVGSQQMTSEAWQSALDLLAGVVGTLNGRGILLDHVNLGGGLPALGVLDKRGRPLDPPVDKMFAMIREGVQRLREVSASPLDFLLEPGRHLVADHGAIRAHVSRLTARRQPSGELRHWLYLSCGKFNGLYEMDELQYRLEFPTHGRPAVRHARHARRDRPGRGRRPHLRQRRRLRPRGRTGPGTGRRRVGRSGLGLLLRRVRHGVHDPGLQRLPAAPVHLRPRRRRFPGGSS
ncbi:type III PLP-dependent enzyme [Kitasatospora aburaviensis]